MIRKVKLIFDKNEQSDTASCYLVKHKAEKVDYVLKRIECEDENAARKAFQEAMALSELKHKSVCGYKEFFVTWDAKNSAMFVCIIMENYPKGDLSRVIKGGFCKL